MRAPHIIFFLTFSLLTSREEGRTAEMRGRPIHVTFMKVESWVMGHPANCSVCHIHSLSFLFAVSGDGEGRRISDLLTVSCCRPLLLLLVVSHGEIALWHVRPEGPMAMPMPPAANGGKIGLPLSLRLLVIP